MCGKGFVPQPSLAECVSGMSPLFPPVFLLPHMISHSFLHLCVRHLLLVFEVLGTVLNAPNTKMTKTESQVLRALGPEGKREGGWESRGQQDVWPHMKESSGPTRALAHAGVRGSASIDHKLPEQTLFSWALDPSFESGKLAALGFRAPDCSDEDTEAQGKVAHDL